MNFEIKNRFTGDVIFTAELEAHYESEPHSTQLGAAVQLAVKARANLARANLARANLARANLARANLAGANLAGANLAGANLAGANLAGANLAGANLAGTNLAGANLAGAYLAGANLAGANLAGTNLAGTNLVDGVKIRDDIVVKQAPICISGLTWFVTIWDQHMQIGCEFHSHDQWRAFDTEAWMRMGGKAAIRLRDAHLGTLMALCDAHAAKVTGPASGDHDSADAA